VQEPDPRLIGVLLDRAAGLTPPTLGTQRILGRVKLIVNGEYMYDGKTVVSLPPELILFRLVAPSSIALEGHSSPGTHAYNLVQGGHL
jgi:hypothetical protein